LHLRPDGRPAERLRRKVTPYPRICAATCPKPMSEPRARHEKRGTAGGKARPSARFATDPSPARDAASGSQMPRIAHRRGRRPPLCSMAHPWNE
jgi:hypothetical protein